MKTLLLVISVVLTSCLHPGRAAVDTSKVKEKALEKIRQENILDEEDNAEISDVTPKITCYILAGDEYDYKITWILDHARITLTGRGDIYRMENTKITKHCR